jgi:hypothetical protein
MSAEDDPLEDWQHRPLGRGPIPPRGITGSDDDEDMDADVILDIALALAARGHAVFPCAASKRPAIPEADGGRGCLDATSDQEAVRKLFARAPNATLVGVACGPASGVDILDIDPRHGGDAWEQQNLDRLPETLIHGTPSGGRHYVFRHHPGVRNRQGAPAPGVDVRGAGGYAIWPPSLGYQVLQDVELAPWPAWLLEQIIRAEPSPRPIVRADPAEISNARLDGLLRSLLTRLSHAPEGQKHETLLRIARTIGGYAHLLRMSDEQLVALMLAALPNTVIDWKNAEDTARDGLAYGRATPLDLEDRPRLDSKRSTPPDPDAEPDHAALNDRLGAAFFRNPALREHWEGGIQGLGDASVPAFLVTEGFTKGEVRAALRIFRHGRMPALERDDPDGAAREFERICARAREQHSQPGQSGGAGDGDPSPPPEPDDRPPPGPGPQPQPVLPPGVALEDFWAYMPLHKYIFATARDLWPGASVNARLPKIPLVDAKGRPVLDDAGNQLEIKASAWLDKHKPVEQMTWAPGQPMIIRDRLINEGATIERPGVSCFNLYLPPPLLDGGNPKRAGRWLDHLRCIYPEKSETDHICRWFAHRVQRPAEKPNHALVLGGPQGIGKDTLIEPLKRALGAWNCAEVSPRTIVEASFNGFARSILLRVSEARDLGEVNRYAFYEAMKVYTAAPPDVLRVNEKNLREFHILNCCGVVMTTNYKSGGIYLPADDRRHFVVWSLCKKEDFSPEYWNDLWAWYENGGIADVAAYLTTLDLSGFNPKAPPPQTPAFWEIVDANRAPEDSELADLLDQIGKPQCVTLANLIDATKDQYGNITGIGVWLGERKNRRVIPHRMEQCGYSPVRNPDADDGLWKIKGKRQAIYAKVTLSLRDQIEAARGMT